MHADALTKLLAFTLLSYADCLLGALRQGDRTRGLRARTGCSSAIGSRTAAKAGHCLLKGCNVIDCGVRAAFVHAVNHVDTERDFSRRGAMNEQDARVPSANELIAARQPSGLGFGRTGQSRAEQR